MAFCTNPTRWVKRSFVPWSATFAMAACAGAIFSVTWLFSNACTASSAWAASFFASASFLSCSSSSFRSCSSFAFFSFSAFSFSAFSFSFRSCSSFAFFSFSAFSFASFSRFASASFFAFSSFLEGVEARCVACACSSCLVEAILGSIKYAPPTARTEAIAAIFLLSRWVSF